MAEPKQHPQHENDKDKDKEKEKAPTGGEQVQVVVTGTTLTPAHAGKGKPRKIFLSLLDGPDIESGKPQEGRETVMTSCGELDKETAVMGRVGGIGTVSIQTLI